jgi:hypothetical protein
MVPGHRRRTFSVMAWPHILRCPQVPSTVNHHAPRPSRPSPSKHSNDSPSRIQQATTNHWQLRWRRSAATRGQHSHKNYIRRLSLYHGHGIHRPHWKIPCSECLRQPVHPRRIRIRQQLHSRRAYDRSHRPIHHRRLPTEYCFPTVLRIQTPPPTSRQ